MMRVVEVGGGTGAPGLALVQGLVGDPILAIIMLFDAVCKDSTNFSCIDNSLLEFPMD